MLQFSLQMSVRVVGTCSVSASIVTVREKNVYENISFKSAHMVKHNHPNY